jgi:NADH:ubiquinone oxidoreductase subunit
MATLGTVLYTIFNGKKAGEDEYGNKYYIYKKASKDSYRRKRWVIYADKADPSLVPALWHCWLHYTIDEVPQASEIRPHDWQISHKPSMTGTKDAYYPKGYMLAGNNRDKASADYEAWTPDDN